MKSHMFILFLLSIGVFFFFQPTHQYHLSKRELTEYDLTSFIVSTCSADQIDLLIQNLCDQTLQSALMGNFPVLTYYCKTIGTGMNYCNNINRYNLINQDAGEKISVSRRRVRSLKEENKVSSQLGQEMDITSDFDLKLIMQICMATIEKSSLDAIQFCSRTLQERYSEIDRFCKDHPDFDFCRLVRSYSSLFSWPMSTTRFIPLNMNPSFVSSSKFKSVDIDQQNINTSRQEPSTTSPSSAVSAS